jgi:predicted PurR-regulated permease PerM
VTISTVGYGDIAAYTQSEQQFVIAIIVMGAFIYAFIIGEFSSLINNMNREKSDFDAKMRKIQGMLGYIQAPDDLFHRVVNFYGRC